MVDNAGHSRFLPFFAACTVFLSAWLLFLVEPIAAKNIVPYLGGSPQVWNTSMVFFQLCLLAGYLCAYLILKIDSARMQACAYGVLLAAALFFLPLAITVHSGIDSIAFPVTYVLSSLFSSLFLPFLLLSTTNTLVQGWLSRGKAAGTFNPYTLYAASNAGSFLALLSFFLLELYFPLNELQRLWTLGFYLFCALIFSLTVYQNLRAKRQPAQTESALPVQALQTRQRLYWIALSFVPSALFLSVTTYITTEVGPVPLFWVMPLGIYLLTFVLAFSDWSFGIERSLTGQVTLITMVGMLLGFNVNFYSEFIPLHLICLFAVGLGCHGLLARSKPHPKHLGEFYLWVSLGGVLGGIFASIIAPQLFTGPAEYPLMLVAACLLRPNVQAIGDKAARLRHDILYPLLVLAASLGLAALLQAMVGDKTPMAAQFDGWAKAHLQLVAGNVPTHRSIEFLVLLVWITTLAGLCHKRSAAFALLMAGLLFLPGFYIDNGEQLYVHRNFFGISKVYRGEPDINVFVHDTTIHGMQSLKEGERMWLASYYGPLRDIYGLLAEEEKHYPAALMGLGAGIGLCTSSGIPRFDIFEINPDVVKIASDPALFTYMRDCPPAKKVYLGDARIKMALMPDSQYGLIVSDVYSSGSVPMHLLTREALLMDISKLSPHGIIAFHISSHLYNLAQLFRVQMQALPVQAYVMFDPATRPGVVHGMASIWVIMTRSFTDDQQAQAKKLGWRRLEAASGRIWTDQYSNILPYLK